MKTADISPSPLSPFPRQPAICSLSLWISFDFSELYIESIIQQGLFFMVQSGSSTQHNYFEACCGVVISTHFFLPIPSCIPVRKLRLEVPSRLGWGQAPAALHSAHFPCYLTATFTGGLQSVLPVCGLQDWHRGSPFSFKSLLPASLRPECSGQCHTAGHVPSHIPGSPDRSV